MNNLLHNDVHNNNSNQSTPQPPSQVQGGSPNPGYPRLPSLGGGLPPLPQINNNSHRNPMSVSSMVSPTTTNRPIPQNPLDRSAGPQHEALPRIPDYVRRPNGAASPDTSAHSVQLPHSNTSANQSQAHSPPRPAGPSLHSARSASSTSATANSTQPQPGPGPAGASRGGGYPPLPSAFARENPYSHWPPKARQSETPTATAQPSAATAGSPSAQSHSLPPSQHQATPGASSFAGYNRNPSNQPHSQPPHQHAPSAQSQAPPQPPRQAGSPYAPGHPWGNGPAHPSARPSEQQQQQQGGSSDYYSRLGYPGSGQHPPRPSVPTQKSDPSASVKPSNNSPRFGAVSTMPGQPPAPASAGSPYNQPPANGHHQDSFNPRHAPEPAPRGPPPAGPATSAPAQNGHAANGHKRRRSEHAAPVRQPPTAPFTLAQQRKAEIRPPLLKVDSAPVLASVPAPAGGRPHLGRKVYCPFTEPAQLLSADLLKNGVGGVIEVAVPLGCLEGARWQVGNPEEYQGEDEAEIPSEVWELEGLRKRKVWGSDIYTDDSDVVAIALHSGWLRLSSVEGTLAEESPKAHALLVKLLVTPALIRYQGCTRQGIRSRSWGNGHEGVSLMVLGIEPIDERVVARGRKLAVVRAAECARLLETEGAEGKTFVLAPWGGGKQEAVEGDAKEEVRDAVAEAMEATAEAPMEA